jgi:hypothetical protein
MARGPHRLLRKLAVLLACALLLVGPALPAASAAASPGTPAPAHQMGCVLISGRLYVGDPGAGPNPQFVICDLQFRQVHPRSDGVILVLRQARHRTAYSIHKVPAGLHPAGRRPLPWRHHPGPVKIVCALADGHLYLGSTGPAHPRRKATCTLRFFQLTPAADGVTIVLRTATTGPPTR